MKLQISWLLSFFLSMNVLAETKLFVLGTGTPNPDPQRMGSSYLLLVDEQPYLIDFGIGVIRRFSELTEEWGGELKIDTTSIDHAFLTHMHSDHNLGLSDLIITPWIMGRENKLKLFGPDGLDDMAENIIKAYEFDINYRIYGTQPQNTTGYKFEFKKIDENFIFQDNNVKVEAFKNNHGDLEESYGFIFKTDEIKIVFSGDTAPSEELVKAAKNADILVHEVYSQSGFEKKTKDWQIYHAAHHTSPMELGKIASEVMPKKLVLSHILYWGASSEEIKEEVSAHFKGEIIVAQDLMQIY